MINGIVICHGNLAEEIVAAARKIIGPAEHIFAFSNEGLDTKTLTENVAGTIRDNSLNRSLIMVDLRGGSCWTAAKMLTREFPEIKVLSGVNLPMLISFLTKRADLDAEELAERLETDAHRGIWLE